MTIALIPGRTRPIYVRAQVAVVSVISMTLSYSAEGLRLIGGGGAFADALTTTSTMIDSVMDVMAAPMDCLTAFSAGGDNTVLFAVQNAAGAALAMKLTYGTGTVTQFEKTNVLSSAINAVETGLAAAEPVLTAVTATTKTITAATAINQAIQDDKASIDTSQSASGVWTSKTNTQVFQNCMQKKVSAGLDTLYTVATLGDSR